MGCKPLNLSVLGLLVWMLGITFSQGGFGENIDRSPAAKEYSTLEAELKTKYFHAEERIRELEKLRDEVISLSKTEREPQSEQKVTLKTSLGESEIKTLENYHKIILTRYVDDNGNYQEGLPILQKDLYLLTYFLERYFEFPSSHPNEISAAEAVRIIRWAIKYGKKDPGKYEDPREKTRSQLEILTKQIEDQDKRMKVASRLADRLGVSLPEKD